MCDNPRCRAETWTPDRIDDAIDQSGVALTGVVADISSEVEFAYTTGHHELGLPELLMVGPPAEMGSALLADLSRRLREGRVAAQTGRTIVPARGAECRWPVRFGSVVPHWARHYALATYAHYEVDDPAQIDFLQVILPDDEGGFADQRGCDPLLDLVQPHLSDPVRPFRQPFCTCAAAGLGDLDADVAVAVPVLDGGADVGRDELVLGRRQPDGTVEVVKPPVLADWVTTGTRVATEPSLETHADLPVEQIVAVERQSPLAHLSWWLRHDVDADGALRCLVRLQELEQAAVTLTADSLHLAVAPRHGEPARSAVRHLAKRGHARELRLRHRPHDVA